MAGFPPSSAVWVGPSPSVPPGLLRWLLLGRVALQQNAVTGGCSDGPEGDGRSAEAVVICLVTREDAYLVLGFSGVLYVKNSERGFLP